MQTELITKIVREVLKEKGLSQLPTDKSPAHKPQRDPSAPVVLHVFHPGVRKLEQALEQVSLIEALAAKSSIFTVSSARAWVCGGDVREKAGSRCILDTVQPEGIEKVLQKADILVLPTFCFQTAAKLACLIADNQESAIVMSALIQNKPVLAASDGFTLLDALANHRIQNEIERVLGKLETLGMIFCPTRHLAETFKKMSAGNGPSPAAQTKKASAKQTSPDLKLITAKDIQTAVDNRVESLRLAPGGIITPLATDLARDHNIRIEKTLNQTGR
jgi:hypothetical protein